MKTKQLTPTKKQLAMKISEFGDDKAIELLDVIAAFTDSKKALALAIELDLTLEETRDELTECRIDSDSFEYGREEYRVLTDDEADQANDEYLDNYIDECILHELPERYRMYFDDEKFKRDCAIDGRGHNLSSYDGSESHQKIGDEYYYIYRTN